MKNFRIILALAWSIVIGAVLLLFLTLLATDGGKDSVSASATVSGTP